MYFVKRQSTEIVICGPDNFEKTLPSNGIVIGQKPNPNGWDGELSPCAMRLGDMEDAEIVAYALEI